eukprot:gene380-413_t
MSLMSSAGVVINRPPVDPASFSVVSYNILGPLHGESSKHHYAPVHITKWTRRRDRLMDLLFGLSADVLCLQEVSKRSLRETFLPQLRHIGLQCSGYAPSQVAATTKGALAHKYVGSAIFHNSNKFRLLQSKRLHLRHFVPLKNCVSEYFHVDVATKSNSMVIVLLANKQTDQPIVVANTHLFWDPRREDIKAVQTAACMNAIEAFLQELHLEKTPNLPIVLCGDFNSVPVINHPHSGDLLASAPFQLLRNGALSSRHPQHPDSWYRTLRDGATNPQLGDLKLSRQLDNLFDDDAFQGYRPHFTTKTDDFQGWVDHIWVNGGVNVTGVHLPTVSIKDAQTLSGASFPPIPNQNHPSDHLPVGMICRINDDVQPVDYQQLRPLADQLATAQIFKPMTNNSQENKVEEEEEEEGVEDR